MRLTFALLHYLALALLAACSYVFGRTLTRRVKYNSALEQVSFSVTLGLAVISYLVLFFGVLHLLYSWLILIALLLGLGVCLVVWKDWLRNLHLTLETWRESKTSGNNRR